MRYIIILLIFLGCFATDADGIGRRHRYVGPPRTEAELVANVLECLKYKDSMAYYNLFPPFDTLWRMVMHNDSREPIVQQELAKLREHPTLLINYDPFYNHGIISRFVDVLQKGEDSGVQWRGIVLQRFELQKQSISRGMEGLQHIAPERYQGFVFVRDMLSSTTYCITIAEIQKIKGYYMGGQVLNVLEAKNIDQYMAKEYAERHYLANRTVADDARKADSMKSDTSGGGGAGGGSSAGVDSAAAKKSQGLALPVDTAKVRKQLMLSSNSSAEDDAPKTRKEVVDRKYYKGKFDDEIPVELYVRYMRDVKGKVNNWDALYKFGDMAQYVKLDVSKVDGKWLFEEPVGVMELDLSNRIYMGSWTNGNNQTGYDAELTQKSISQEKILELDRILETGSWGRTDGQTIKEAPDSLAGKKKEEKPKSKKEDDEEEETKEKETPKGPQLPTRDIPADTPAPEDEKDKPAESKKDTPENKPVKNPVEPPKDNPKDNPDPQSPKKEDDED